MSAVAKMVAVLGDSMSKPCRMARMIPLRMSSVRRSSCCSSPYSVPAQWCFISSSCCEATTASTWLSPISMSSCCVSRLSAKLKSASAQMRCVRSLSSDASFMSAQSTPARIIGTRVSSCERRLKSESAQASLMASLFVRRMATTTKSDTTPWSSSACAQYSWQVRLQSALAQKSCVSPWPPRMSATRLFTSLATDATITADSCTQESW
mmetsp:Transcript_44493/g.139556  ORF Transcript_44493/g.139556 Transcript_44493/m.139556 type:complete len:209 (+) Transcript_44493:1900-2526(+)